MNTRPLPKWARFGAEIFGMAAIYYLVGRMSLLLAIPPGYATAIWPAAGLALAGVVAFGPQVCFGVFIGSFFITVWTSLDASSAASMAKSIAVATSIGLGAALQAQVGAFLLRRFAGFPNPLVAQERVLQFVGIGGIGGCLVNCTLGTATLWLAGFVRPENLFFSWWSWWVGDSAGVILFAPLALIWIDRSLPVQSRRRFTVTLPIGLMFIIAVTAYVIESRREQKVIARTFRARTALLTQKLQGDFTDDLEIADFLAGLFSSTNRVTPADFTNFCRRIMAHHGSIESLEWAPQVLETQRTGFEAAARQLGFRNFEITDP
ncbi:MAG TPA: MASE1 domain-containing protein, partial [Chthoniobacteraceae bacterium]